MAEPFDVKHSFVDDEGGYDGWAAVAVADFDGDGRPELATGGKGGGFYHLYDLEPRTGRWTRHVVTREISPFVGAASPDLDGDGRPELVCGEWSGDRLFWIVARHREATSWRIHEVARGIRDAHDVLAADLDGDGRSEIVVREKDGALRMFRVPADPARPWRESVVADFLPGDGTACAKISGRGLDLVTNAGWFENARGDASEWRRHPLIPEDLDWSPETRLRSFVREEDGTPVVVITESEIAGARLAVLTPGAPGRAWVPVVPIPRDLDFRGLHSLQIADLDGDGVAEIFTAEMENGLTADRDPGPRWWCLKRDDRGRWRRHLLLDAGLGTHEAVAADFDGDGRIEIAGKTYRPNANNGNGGRGHVDVLRLRNRG